MSSSSTTEVTTSTIGTTAIATGCHMLKIAGHTRTRNTIGHGKRLRSSQFKAAGRTWCVDLYPNGSSTQCAGYVSLFLRLVGSGGAAADAGLHVEARFSLLRHCGEPEPRVPISQTTTNVLISKESRSPSLGFQNFVNHETLKRSGFFKDDCWAVRIDIAILDELVVEEPVAKACDLERLGIVCTCEDDTCKRYHAPPLTTKNYSSLLLKKAISKLFSGCFQVPKKSP